MNNQGVVAAVMRHALSLAAHGPVTGINPQVGCVILDPHGEMIAEGWHQGAGTAHAEIAALGKLADGQARGATAVVTLEPCTHVGLTAPCTRALIDAGIAKVFYASTDPGAESGGGAEVLLEAGIEATGGVLVDEADAFLHVWLTATRRGSPYVTLKWASSLDGRAAANDGSSRWITGTAARQHVHEQRAAADAIIVGTGTVLADDPSLTARGDAGELLAHQPQPVILGNSELPATARIHNHPKPAWQIGDRELPEVLTELFDRGIRRVFVEGGPTLASAFIAAGLVDEYLVYLAPTLLGGKTVAVGEIGVGNIAEARHLEILSLQQMGDDVLIVARPSIEPGATLSATLSKGAH